MKKLFLVLLIYSGFIFAQVELSAPKEKPIPYFDFEVVNFASSEPAKSRVDLYIKFAYDELQFVKQLENFKASYEVSASLVKNKETVTSKSWEGNVEVTNFDQTNSTKDFVFTSANFNVIPDDFQIVISLTDLNNRKTTYRKKDVKLANFSKMSISDILLINSIEIDSVSGFASKVYPNIPSDFVELTKPVWVYFEVYEISQIDSIEIDYKITDERNKIVFFRVYRIKAKSQNFAEKLQIYPDLPSGFPYSINLIIKQGNNSVSSKKSFNVRWSDLKMSLSDLDRAIEQLRYIIEPKVFSELKKGTAEEKKEKFLAFWKKKDPSPSTPENELMDEYYRRVAYSNENFSVFKEGWKSDRGMIYIVFGPPDDIERHPFDMDSRPYEVWYYYSNLKRRRTFVFVDEHGYGDYRLTTPYDPVFDPDNRNR
jgi:GWxTD domain-containing protein